MQIEPINLRAASDTQYAALNALYNVIRAERIPDDPPIPLQEETAQWRTIPSYIEDEAWAVWDDAGTTAVAFGRVSLRRAEDNQHMVEFDIAVLPEWRRSGLATELLSRLVELPRRENRRLMLAWTCEHAPAGEAFMARIGGKRGLNEKVSQLDLSQLNRELLREWIARAPERAAGFELNFWEGSFPEADVQSLVDLFHVMNTAPRQNLELEDEVVTPAQMREWEASLLARGIVRWTLVAREQSTGRLAGFTEVFWQPSRGHLLYQGGTGVRNEYRGKGLGRWLKAAMIEKVLRERPQVKFVRTDNADSNAPMLKINYELGFKPYFVNHAWQVEVQAVTGYLNSRMPRKENA